VDEEPKERIDLSALEPSEGHSTRVVAIAIDAARRREEERDASRGVVSQVMAHWCAVRRPAIAIAAAAAVAAWVSSRGAPQAARASFESSMDKWAAHGDRPAAAEVLAAIEGSP
jgi:hypothetical protein